METKRKCYDSLGQMLPEQLRWEDVLFVCIGTDRSTGDSLGPLVGTDLKKLGYNVIGTLHDPVHAVNLKEVASALPTDKVIISVDASLGNEREVGQLRYRKGPLRPGAGVGKDLPPVGDYHIVGIVNIEGFMEYFVLQNTRLSQVLDMRDEIVEHIVQTLPRYTGAYTEGSTTAPHL